MMCTKNRVVKFSVVLILFLIILFVKSNAEKDFTVYVDPFIGTQHEGHCFPGATVPLGMVQASPESFDDYRPGYTMDHVAGYQYSDRFIWGFTQTHLNGAGCPSMSDILLMPYDKDSVMGLDRKDIYSTYRKSSELATPGYYSAFLSDFGINAELTCTPHVAYHRYTFNKKESARLIVDLQYGVSWDINAMHANVVDAHQSFEDAYTLSGYRKTTVWTSRDVYYTIRFNKKIIAKKRLNADPSCKEIAPRYSLTFDRSEDTPLEVVVALSTVSVAAAKKNLKAEISGWDTFDLVQQKAKKQWNAVLSRIDVKGSKEKKIAFYTSMYHLYIQPNNIADVDSCYRAEDGKVRKAPMGVFYSTLSLWDTYRAAHPMYTILTPNLVKDVISSMMYSYENKPVDSNNPCEANKYLPRWQLWGKETHTMIGNHAVPVIVDAYLKGIKTPLFSREQVFDAIWTSVTTSHYRNQVALIDSFGYIPYDMPITPLNDGRETVSRLLEGTYDDHCAAIYAKELNKKKEFDFLSNRSTYYKNVFDTKSGFMRGRDRKGNFKQNIDLSEVVGEWFPMSDFTEGNAYHYLFHVQHDIPGLIQEMGGEKRFADRLDSIFFTSSKPVVKTLDWQILGTMGQYWHGNEPCHHVPYLYKFTNKPYKTDQLIRTLVEEYYQNTPDGLGGNDDCGQMSAWYMFSVMGLYPVNPCGGEYVLGAPQVPELVIHLPNGNDFKIVAKDLSSKKLYVKTIFLNGVEWKEKTISHRDILKGGSLQFVMCSEPKCAAK